MKTLISPFLLVLLLSNHALFGQTESVKTIYYKYELTPTGEISVAGDTVYRVFFHIDNEDLSRLRSLIIMKGDKDVTFTVEGDAMENDQRIQRLDNVTKFDIDEWSGTLNWIVLGETLDSEQVYLKDIYEKDHHGPTVFHTVIIPAKPTVVPKDTIEKYKRHLLELTNNSEK